MDWQKLMDALNAAGQAQRRGYHLTLGGLVSALGKANGQIVVEFDEGGTVGDLGSYRGYYSDLALEPGDALATAGALLDAAREAVGKTYQGYKGGDYTMDAETPLWMADYGCCGRAVVGFGQRDGKLILRTKAVD